MKSLSLRWYITGVAVIVSLVSLAAGGIAMLVDQQARSEAHHEFQAESLEQSAANELASIYFRTEGRLDTAAAAMDDPPTEQSFGAAVSALQLLNEYVSAIQFETPSETWARPVGATLSPVQVQIDVDGGRITAGLDEPTLQAVVQSKARALGSVGTGTWSMEGPGTPVPGLGGYVEVDAGGVPLVTIDRDVIAQATGTGLVVATASATGGALAGTLLVRPLKRLTNDVRAVSRGEPPAQPRGPKEIRDLNATLEGVAKVVAKDRKEFFEAQQRMGAHLSRTNVQVAEQELRIQRLFEGISHDIKGPLISATVFLQAHGRLSTDPHLERGLAALRRLRRIVARLELLSRASNPIECQPTELAPLVAEVVGNVAAEASAHGRMIDVEGPPIRVMADPERLGMVLKMLLENAIVHGGETRIRWTSGEVCKIIIEDGGAGFEFTPDVLEPFGMRKDEPGIRAGLGLPIVSRLVASMAGGLRIESDAKGTQCTITLPRSS